MKMQVVLVLVLAVFCWDTSLAGNGPGNGTGEPLATLDETESVQLVFMREEEKLARDVYINLYDLWLMKPFLNISNSEQNHMDSMLKMLNKFGITDPVVSDEVGTFSDASNLAAFYQQLIERGSNSQLDALFTGAYVEEMSIRDLLGALAYTDEPALINSYSNLLAASRNHLRIFVSHISALGVAYVAQILDQVDVDDIVGGHEVTPGENFLINPGLNDAWYYPGTDGQGFFITVLPGVETVFLGWFTYDTELPSEGEMTNLGHPGLQWMTAQGSYSGGQALLEINFMFGGVFDSGDPLPDQSTGGSILLQFDDCATGSVTYDIPSIDRAGFIPIARMAPDNIALCQQLNANR